LEPGESREVCFVIDADRLSYFEPTHLEWTIEPGEVEIMIGSNARETEGQVIRVNSE
jgi:beta-glucosidase